jgi:hypothetical protein
MSLIPIEFDARLAPDSGGDSSSIGKRMEFEPSQLKFLVVDNEAAHARAMTESLE